MIANIRLDKIIEDMKELYFFDETFYWGRSGKRATVIEAECEMTQDVRPDELRAAVVSALRVHRNFRARPVIVGRRFLVEDSEAPLGSVPHRRTDGSTYTITAHLKKVE